MPAMGIKRACNMSGPSPERNQRAVDAPTILRSTMSILDQDIYTNIAHFRVRTGDRVRYLHVQGRLFDDSTMDKPDLLLAALPDLPDTAWKQSQLSQDADGQLNLTFSDDAHEEVRVSSGAAIVEVLTLRRGASYAQIVYETEFQGHKAIAKIAPFQRHNYRIERESRAYSLLENIYERDASTVRLSPRVLGHLAEEGRVMGILLEMIEGRPADSGDFEACGAVLRRLHQNFGLAHGDPYSHNFVVNDATGTVTLVDFEHMQELSVVPEAANEDLLMLRGELCEGVIPGGPSGIPRQAHT